MLRGFKKVNCINVKVNDIMFAEILGIAASENTTKTELCRELIQEALLARQVSAMKNGGSYGVTNTT